MLLPSKEYCTPGVHIRLEERNLREGREMSGFNLAVPRIGSH